MMASSKNNTFKVKLKAVPQKKRRKSDLVVMWHAILDATMNIVQTFHLLMLGVLKSARLMIWQDEVEDIRQFLKKYLPVVPNDFSNSWRDGKLLCILLNKLQPGCIPDAEALDHNYALRNMYHAFDILERKFGISPSATVEQLVVCVEGSHLKLLEILSQVKKESENKLIPSIQVEEVESENEKQNCHSDSKNCLCKGTGLMVAFVGRPANFVIFISAMTDISLVIEIKGPNKTVCRERITKRSPKKKLSTTVLEQSRPPFLRSNSFTEKNSYQLEVDKADDREKSLIPLEYDISLNKISVSYTPLVEGEHVISILWYGQHVSDSPYVVKVEPAVEPRMVYVSKQFIPTFKLREDSDDNGNKERKNGTVTIQKPMNKIERIGKVMKRRVLRHIVKIKDKDIIIDTNDIEHLAAALLKMDYEIQTNSSNSRRNSWGFDGDAERKISAIRQFFIPLHELDSQNMKLHGRSRSLTINSNPRMPLKRCNSLEEEEFIRQKLETVSEDAIYGYNNRVSEHSDQNEEEFAYINEDFQKQELLPGENQAKLLDDEVEEEVFVPSVIPNSTRENMLQSLPTEENFCNDLNAKLYLELPQNSLTGSSHFSEQSAVPREKQLSSNVNEYNGNELMISANPSEETKEAHNASNVGNSLEFEKSSWTASFEIRKESRQNEMQCDPDIYEEIEKELIINSSTFNDNNNNNLKYVSRLNEKLQNLSKFDVSFSTFKSEEEQDAPKMSFQVLFPEVNETNNWKLPLSKSSKNLNLISLGKRYQGHFEVNRDCRSCRRLKILNRKLISLNKKVRNKNSSYFKAIQSEAFSHLDYQTENTSTPKSIEMRANNIVEVQNNSPSPKHDRIEFEKSKFKLYKSPVQYSSYFYSKSGEDQTATHSEFSQSKHMKATQANEIASNPFPLLPVEKEIDSKKNSSNDNLYFNSTLRLNYNSSNDPPTSPYEFDIPTTDLKDVPGTTEKQFKEYNLLSLGQYNFNQFNPSAEKKKGSLIKNRIKKLERSMVSNSQKVDSKFSSRSSLSSNTANVKDKLAFWENWSREEKKTIPTEVDNADESTSSENRLDDVFLINGSELDQAAFKGGNATDDISWPKDDALNETKNNSTSNNENISYQPIDSKINNLPYQRKKYLKMRRSFSDPLLLDPVSRESLIFAQNPLSMFNKLNTVSSTENMSSSGDYLESSIDDGLYSSDPFASTEDEYIDDEIPGNPLLTHWGDVNLMKSLKMESLSKYKEYCQSIDAEILKNPFQSVEICPSECKVYGIGTYYGYVAVKNRFQVLTKGAGNGNLSASIQGFGKHDVSLISVKYKRRDVYEVTYQVLRPGLYLISLRWMEKPIVGSPFLCKVSF